MLARRIPPAIPFERTTIMPQSTPPRRYGEPVADEICRRLAGGEALRAICADVAMPAASTVRRWRRTRVGFAARLEAAAAPGRCRRGPVRLTGRLFDEICRRLADGEFLTAICRDPHMPVRRTVHRRVRKDEALRARYAEARALQVEHLFEQIVTIADEDDNPARARLRIEARKWLVVKLDPDRFGDKDKAERQRTGVDTAVLERGRARTDHDG
jgi:hypothetical protein